MKSGTKHWMNEPVRDFFFCFQWKTKTEKFAARVIFLSEHLCNFCRRTQIHTKMQFCERKHTNFNHRLATINRPPSSEIPRCSTGWWWLEVLFLWSVVTRDQTHVSNQWMLQTNYSNVRKWPNGISKKWNPHIFNWAEWLDRVICALRHNMRDQPNTWGNWMWTGKHFAEFHQKPLRSENLNRYFSTPKLVMDDSSLVMGDSSLLLRIRCTSMVRPDVKSSAEIFDENECPMPSWNEMKSLRFIVIQKLPQPSNWTRRPILRQYCCPALTYVAAV